MHANVSFLRFSSFLGILMKFSSNRIVDGVKFLPSQFGRFRQLDLERLKDDNKWLSDAHITFALRFVPLFDPLEVFIELHPNTPAIVFETVWIEVFGEI